MLHRIPRIVVVAALLLPNQLAAQEGDPLVAAYPADQCPSCAEWNARQRPFRLYANTYYVGTHGLSSLLITSPEGHVLIDGGLPNSAPMILENIRLLGFAVSDVRLIVNSHAHYDHAGGLAALQRTTGARVAASAASASVIMQGRVGTDDPQYGIALDMPAASVDEILDDGQTVRVGSLAMSAHFTPGHPPGGTSWTWRSCEADRCLHFVYADSQTPVSREGFRFSDSDAYPTAVADFQRGFAILEQLPCDVLVTPHPAAASLWDRIAAGSDGLVDAEACRKYAASARQQLQRRLQREAESDGERQSKH